MIDLNPNHLETVKAILAEHVPECEVRAFGSRATWTAKDYSDLDLAIVGEGPMDWSGEQLQEDKRWQYGAPGGPSPTSSAHWTTRLS